MILKEEDIKNILNKKSAVVGNRSLGIKLNQYEYTAKELLDLVQTYILQKRAKSHDRLHFGTTMATKRDRRSTSTRQSSTYSWSKYAIQWLRIRKQLCPN